MSGMGVETGEELGVRNLEAVGGCSELGPTTSSRNSSSADGELRRGLIRLESIGLDVAWESPCRVRVRRVMAVCRHSSFVIRHPALVAWMKP